MTEPTPTTVRDVMWGDREEVLKVLGIDGDMPLSQLREDLTIAARVRQCTAVDGQWVEQVSLPDSDGGVSTWWTASSVDLLGWLREGSNQ